MNDCIFCQIAAGTAPCHKVWEDDKHLAFLSIFPNTEGFSVLITNAHQPSYMADADPVVLKDMIAAVQKACKSLDAGFDDVGRTGVIFEGFGVDHLHAKLFPMHGTKTDEWKQRRSRIEDQKYFKRYEGYIASNDFKRADDAQLAALAKRIRERSQGKR
ncbi:MAG: HIT family protein [Candidatus Diapherotrites archaeon]|nr:HIT family protein [Candidatus Diapherotrites archaeon]